MLLGVLVALAEGAGVNDPAVLHDDVHVVDVEGVDVGGDVAVDNQQVGALANLEGAGLVLDVAHLGAVEGGAGDGLDRGEADLVDELVHLLDGAGAVRGNEGEGVGTDGHHDAALLSLAQAVVVALQLLLDQGALVLVMQLGHVDRRIGGVPGGQEGDRRGEEGALLGHEVHGALVDVEAVDQLLAAKADGIVSGGVVVVAVAPHGDADHLGLIDHGLDLLGAVVLVATGVPAPDAAAGSPDLDGVGVLAKATTNGLAQIPRTVDLIAPGMGLFVLELAAVVGVTVAGSAAEAQTGSENAGALEDALLNAVADLDAEAADLADGGQAMGEAVIGLLDGDGLLLEQRLHDPVGVIVGEVAGEVQMGVDQAGHNGLAGGVDNLGALGHILHSAGVLDLAVLVNEDEGVLDRIGTGAVDELTANDCKLSGHGSSLWIQITEARGRICWVRAALRKIAYRCVRAHAYGRGQGAALRR